MDQKMNMHKERAMGNKGADKEATGSVPGKKDQVQNKKCGGMVNKPKKGKK